MVAPTARKLKVINLEIDGTDYACQLVSWTLDPGIPDGDTIFTFCPDGEAVDEGEPNRTLQLVFLSDWSITGISHILTENTGDEVPFVLEHHPDIPTEHVTWTGVVKLKAPPVGGEARAVERTEITLKVVGEPVYARGV